MSKSKSTGICCLSGVQVRVVRVRVGVMSDFVRYERESLDV